MDLFVSEGKFHKCEQSGKGQGFTSFAELQEVLTYNVGYRKEVPSKKKIFGIIDWLRNPYEGVHEGNAKEPMIVTTKVTHGIVYTICKYDEYQSPDTYEGNNEGRDEGSAKVLRRYRQGNNKYKNVKNDKNDNINGRQQKAVRTDILTLGSQNNVRLTEVEKTRLINEHGQNVVEGAIEFLSLYIVDHGDKSKADTHNATIRRWVIDAVKERMARQGNNPKEEGTWVGQCEIIGAKPKG